MGAQPDASTYCCTDYAKLWSVLVENLDVLRCAMHAMHFDHIRPEKTDVAEKLRVVHSIT